MKQSRQHQTEALNAMRNNSRGVINLPTGTGKTFIQAAAIMEDILAGSAHEVYVVLAPRIVLANQLRAEIYKMLDDASVEAQYLIVHSGRPEDLEDIKEDPNTPLAKATNTTRISEIKKDVERAQRRNLPLIICGTYHSADRIRAADIRIKLLMCDEAHNIVTEQFEWIADDRWSVATYFFTATLRVTSSDDGVGMNNVARFGEVIYRRNPAEMIVAGEIVRPRMHLVNATVAYEQEDSADVMTVIESFTEHRAVLNVAPKLLVVTKGTEHLNKIVNDQRFNRFVSNRPSMTVFDISSQYGPRINGISVDRVEFLKQLKVTGEDSSKEMIVLHIDILTEGIDVPGITGVLLFDNMSMIKFIQTVGRASRLHAHDRARLYNKTLAPSEIESFVKPYAYVIVPVYGVEGNDRFATIREMVAGLRDYDFNPQEDVIIRKSDGKFTPEPIQTVTQPTQRAKVLIDFFGDFVHEMEDRRQADNIRQIASRIKTVDDLSAAMMAMV